MNPASKRLTELMEELNSLVKESTKEAREAIYQTIRSEHYPQSLFDNNWTRPALPTKWVDFDQMCSATIVGVGSGEGHLTGPGIMACTRLAGHKDCRNGDPNFHTWGPERYNEQRAKVAARRVASEDWSLSNDN